MGQSVLLRTYPTWASGTVLDCMCVCLCLLLNQVEVDDYVPSFLSEGKRMAQGRRPPVVAMGNEGFCLGMCQPCCHPRTFTLTFLSLEVVARGVEVPPSWKPQCELEPTPT